MAKTALYQKYRSGTFEEVVGQEYVVRSIKNAVRTGKIGHAYLFCGPRGTGKTTMARLLAKSVNCTNPDHAPCGECENCRAAMNGTHPDIVEINAANETHVEDIRDLIERSRLAPMMGRHKIYIVDEVHQLSSAASSALLKTLEEPPENVIFVLATTDPQKLLPTIISRCQRFDFSKVKKNQITNHLLSIAEKENIRMEESAAEMIAVLADGGMRDALSIMDQCASYTGDNITLDAIDQIYGLATTREKIDLIKNILTKNLEGMLSQISSYEERGIDLQRFTEGMVDILKECVIWQNTHKSDLLKVLTMEEANEISEIADSLVCMHIAEEMLYAKERFKNAVSAVSAFEVICLSLATEGTKPQKVQETAPVSMPQRIQPAPAPVRPSQETVSVQNVNTAVNKEEKSPIPEISEQPAVQKPVIPVQTVEKIDQLKIIQLLVQCSKAEKVKVEAAFTQMRSMMNLESRKYISMLQDTVIGASGEDCIVLVTKQQAVANRINEPSFNRDLYEFTKTQLNTDKIVFAITEDDFREASAQFRIMMRDNSLPEACKVEKYSEQTVREETPEDKVIALFGKENVEIIGG